MTNTFGREVEHFPDPFLAASVYCSGHLDEVLTRVVQPTLGSLRGRMGETAYLWTMRYGRGGEHLKVRLHGPGAGEREGLRAEIDDRAHEFLRSLGEPDPDEARRVNRHAPPIDVEDEAEEACPDRHLEWTRYRRSHVSLAGPPFLDDDRYVALFTRCLGVGCEIVLSLLADRSETTHPQRQSALFKTLVAGLAQLDLGPGQRAELLAYHRDWLVRFPILKQKQDPEKVDQMLERLEAQAAKRPQVLETLARVAQGAWTGSPGDGDPQEEGDLLHLWGRGVAALLDHVRSFEGHPGYRLDPFAADPAFVPLFKLFHGFANQLGLSPLNEALAHHLLLRAVAGNEAGRRIDLLPAEVMGEQDAEEHSDEPASLGVEGV